MTASAESDGRRRQRELEAGGHVVRCCCRGAGPSACRVEHGVWLVSRWPYRALGSPERTNGPRPG